MNCRRHLLQTYRSKFFPSASSFTSYQALTALSPLPSPVSPLLSDIIHRCAAAAPYPLAVLHATQLHAHVSKSGLLSPLSGPLISLYAKSAPSLLTRQLFDELPHPDVYSLSSLISSLADNGLPAQALKTFSSLNSCGFRFNEFTFPSLLKASSSLQDFSSGHQIHCLVISIGFEFDLFVANSLVLFYSKVGPVSDALKLFNGVAGRNVVSWNTLLSSYAKKGFFSEAFDLFGKMIVAEMKPNEFTLSSLISASADAGDLLQGKIVHGYSVKLGHDSDPFTANAIVDMYAKISDLTSAESAFRSIDRPDTISWNSLMAGLVLHCCHTRALEIFSEMRRSGTLLNEFSLSIALTACAGGERLILGEQIHGFLLKAGTLQSDFFVGVGIIDLYAKCGRTHMARSFFDEVDGPDLISWNAMISGYTHSGLHYDALSLFQEMREKGVSFNRTTLSSILKSTAALQFLLLAGQLHALSMAVGLLSDDHVINGLIDAYGKSDGLEHARKIYEENPLADVISFTSMISSYAQNAQEEEALKLFRDSRRRDAFKFDAFVYSTLLNACATLSAHVPGKQMHVHVMKLGFLRDKFASNAIVFMYSKCGDLADASRAFWEMEERETVSWSAMIAGLAQHGRGKEALCLFDLMLESGVPPNHVTLTSVLAACNHAGLVDEARGYFSAMEEDFRVEKTQEHYACMVDVLGRAGKLDEALGLVETMPFEANKAVWGALLAASRVHGNVELGQRAADNLLVLEQDKSGGTHVLLANTYAAAGLWDDVASVRRMMRERKVKKEPAVSWIELKGKVHAFVSDDQSHPMKEMIYKKLDELGEVMEKMGYVALVEADLHDVERGEKERLLARHSERLAVALGLISTPPGVTIIVKKNIRVCGDCHSAIKLISQIVSREIVLRDINRFHHFRDGWCSCNDYW